MNDIENRTEHGHASAQEIVNRLNPVPRKYDSLTYSVSTLNEQIAELVKDNQTLEDGIEAWETEIARMRGEIRRAKRQRERNEAEANKLRAKRQIVSEAAYKAAVIDQP